MHICAWMRKIPKYVFHELGVVPDRFVCRMNLGKEVEMLNKTTTELDPEDEALVRR